MELMMATWTEERLEERFAQIDGRFDRLEAVVAVKSETRELRTDVQALKSEIRALREEIASEFRELRQDIAGIHLMMHRDRQIIIVTLLTVVLTALATGLTN
jgi:uncharacterized coiled-coil DUF342 family protein